MLFCQLMLGKLLRSGVKRRCDICLRSFTEGSNVNLKSVLSEKIKLHREKVKEFKSKYAKTKLEDVTVDMLYGGMRGLTALIWEISLLDPEEGIRFRGHSIPELQKILPKSCDDGGQPLPEGIFWLLLTGDIPTRDQIVHVSEEWAGRSQLPKHVVRLLDELPTKCVHPMNQLSCAVTAMGSESTFVASRDTIKKTVYWEYIYEDAMSLIAKLTSVAAKIYLNTFKSGKKPSPIEHCLDWSANFCKMIGFMDNDFVELMRLYLTIHCDHEGGNVSGHTTHLVGSTLADPYLSYAAGMNGLAGPLHGLANQECLIFLNQLRADLGDTPDDEVLKTYLKNLLKSGKVVPGFGHAILRKTDPRYTVLREFSLDKFPDDPLFKLVAQLYKVVPPILEATGKVKNPWPNVDAHSGIALSHYGMKEMSFYTVLFGVSRALGVLSQLIWSRALGFPIERPKSITTDALKKLVGY